jgi:hypothetical protein
MSVIGEWELFLFEHCIEKKLNGNELKFSKSLNQIQSNTQVLILNQDLTFIMQSINKKFDLHSVYQGQYSLSSNRLSLISQNFSTEEFELLQVNSRILRLEQKLYTSNLIKCLKNNESHIYRFGFVKI